MTKSYELVGIAHENIRKGDYVIRRGSELMRIDMEQEGEETERVIKKEMAELFKNSQLTLQVNLNKIICKDATEFLKELPDESVDCIVTSPPYWNLRDYGVDGQLGLESTFEKYISELCDIFDEAKRVLKKEGTCWVNMGDTYSGMKIGNTETRKNKKVVSNTFKKEKTKLPDKCLCQIPSRFAIEMTNRGWILRNEIIWYKPNCMPSSASDRFTVDFEKMFFFVKSKKYYFEQQKEPTITKDSIVRDRDTTKLNNTPGRSRMGGLKENNYDFKNKRCVWKITTKPFSEAHFAVYPKELVETPIKASCPPKGTVLDFFGGSGTTQRVAQDLERNWLYCDLNPEYCEIARKRLRQTVLEF